MDVGFVSLHPLVDGQFPRGLVLWSRRGALAIKIMTGSRAIDCSSKGLPCSLFYIAGPQNNFTTPPNNCSSPSANDEHPEARSWQAVGGLNLKCPALPTQT
jgi:hypothetical protein